jgi:DNA-binding NtrC family response regulator
MLRTQLLTLVRDLVDRGVHYDEAAAEFERAYFAEALGRRNGRIAEAAEAIGVHRNTFSRKVAEYGLRSRAARTKAR